MLVYSEKEKGIIDISLYYYFNIASYIIAIIAIATTVAITVAITVAAVAPVPATPRGLCYTFFSGWEWERREFAGYICCLRAGVVIVHVRWRGGQRF